MNTRNATTPRQRYVVSITAENPLLQDTAAILAAQIGVVDVSLNQIVIFDPEITKKFLKNPEKSHRNHINPEENPEKNALKSWKIPQESQRILKKNLKS